MGGGGGGVLHTAVVLYNTARRDKGHLAIYRDVTLSYHGRILMGLIRSAITSVLLPILNSLCLNARNIFRKVWDHSTSLPVFMSTVI